MVMSNINDNFFDGHYKEIWKALIPEELTGKEVEFMIAHFNLQPGSCVLDLMCGYGRHALALGRKGINVEAVDNLGDYIKEINETANTEGLPVKAEKADVIQYAIKDQADLAICMGNSLNFFNGANTSTLLSNIAAHLTKGGFLLINSWSIAEIVFHKLQTNTWSQIGGFKFLNTASLSFQPTRVEVESIMIAPDGSSETKKGIDYIFSINELETMLANAGLQLKEVYSIPGRKKFSVGEPRAYLVAQKL